MDVKQYVNVLNAALDGKADAQAEMDALAPEDFKKLFIHVATERRDFRKELVLLKPDFAQMAEFSNIVTYLIENTSSRFNGSVDEITNKLIPHMDTIMEGMMGQTAAGMAGLTDEQKAAKQSEQSEKGKQILSVFVNVDKFVEAEAKVPAIKALLTKYK